MVDRSVVVELTDLGVRGDSYCSLAFEAFPDDSAMDTAFTETVASWLDGLTQVDLDPGRSASYPRWR